MRNFDRQPQSGARPGLPVRLAVNLSLALVLVAVLLYRNGAIQVLRVSSINMAPTLELEDRVMVRAYGGEPVLGDVVVYRSPFDPEHLQVGRIVGVAGNRVELTEGGLQLDGKPAAVPISGECEEDACEAGAAPEDGGTCAASHDACRVAGTLVGAEAVGDRRFFTRRPGSLSRLLFPAVTVPDQHFFVLSDNRVDERDSRIYGAIPHHAVVGVLSFVYYASDETGIRWDRMSRRVS